MSPTVGVATVAVAGTPAVGDSAGGAATDALAAGGSGVSLGSAAGPATAAVDTAGVVVA